MNFKILLIRLKQIKFNMISIKKQLKSLHYYLKTDLHKYEHLTGEDLVYKPGVIEQATISDKNYGKNCYLESFVFLSPSPSEQC